MASKKKPVVLLVFGILNLVFGGLGLVCSVCTGIMYGGLYVGIRALYDQAPAEAKAELEGLGKAIMDNVPGLMTIVIVQAVVSLLRAVLQLVSGIGLVGIRNWGRWLCVIWGLLTIVTVSATLFYQLTVINPAMQKAGEDLNKWMEKMEQRQADKGQPPMARQRFDNLGGTGNPAADLVLTTFFPGLVVIYAALAIIIMVMPSTGKAIAEYHGAEVGFVQDSQEDIYDEDYLRRRREPNQPSDGGGGPGY